MERAIRGPEGRREDRRRGGRPGGLPSQTPGRGLRGAGGTLRCGRRRPRPVRRGRRGALPRAHGPDPSMAPGLDIGLALFDTAIGPCGIAWNERGIAGVQLPEGSPPETRARLQRRFPEAREAPPPAPVREAIEGVVALLRGEPCKLDAVTLDMDGVPPFHRRVYEVARTIPP